MPLYEINTVSTYRHKYMIESKQLNDAYDILRAGNVDEISTQIVDAGFEIIAE